MVLSDLKERLDKIASRLAHDVESRECTMLVVRAVEMEVWGMEQCKGA